MQTVSVELKNCYGIGEFDHTFDFSRSNIYSIYAPNGFMKTSFAKTLRDYSINEVPKDLIFPDRVATRKVVDEKGLAVDSKQFFVIESFIEEYSSANISTLLVNKELKKEYDEAVMAILSQKKALDSKLHKLIGKTKFDIDSKVLSIFNQKDLWKCYSKINNLLDTVLINEKLASTKYLTVFTDKVQDQLNKPDFIANLSNYIENFNQVISKSNFLTGEFTPVKALTLHNSLSENSFFTAKHKIQLCNKEITDDYIDIETADELLHNIENELNKALEAHEVVSAYNKLDSDLNKNAALKKFRDYIKKNKEILPELADFNSLEKQYWLSYFLSIRSDLTALIEIYNDQEENLKRVQKEARNQYTQWQNVLDIFKQRFSVPFKMNICNQEDVILKGNAPNIQFSFCENGEIAIKERSELLQVLSRGEKRALYLLQILFELEAKKAQQVDCILIIDDIADSFDYKNKYAIVQYFSELAINQNFKLIFLTHNFDFHRTITKRLSLSWQNHCYVSKEQREVKLNNSETMLEPSTHIKSNLDKIRTFLGAVPFARNIVEYTTRVPNNDATYLKLTSFLHLKPETATHTLEELEGIYKSVFKDLKNYSPNINLKQNYLDALFHEADSIVQQQQSPLDLQSKTLMSIAIRILNEIFLESRIAGVNSMHAKDKYTSIREAVDLGHVTSKEKVLIDQVALMTPENIHLNSFMIEPILDMDSHHLIDLYSELKNIQPVLDANAC